MLVSLKHGMPLSKKFWFLVKFVVVIISVSFCVPHIILGLLLMLVPLKLIGGSGSPVSRVLFLFGSLRVE